MRAENTALLSPSGPELPLLFEASRLLTRYAELEEALLPLLALLESRGRLERGLAILAVNESDEPLVVAATDPRDAALIGQALPASSALSALLSGESKSLEGEVLASAILVHGSASGLLAFRPRGGVYGPAETTLLESVAALVAEALLLRRRILELPAKSGDGERPRASRYGSSGQRPSAGALSALVGRSQAMLELSALLEKVAPTDSTVLISGESGTGKELAARAIHELSARAQGPFIAVNCAALPEALIESELFGHERGAFTGAQARRLGRFELAEGGTLFLDEVAELQASLQAKLLRVLQERSFERVGGGKAIKADVRVIAATNRDLEREVFESRFRPDLYWRLAVFPIRMPPLRERGGDVVLLADHFTEKYSRRLGRPVSRISTPALDLLTSYHWPGNVRELENAIERAVILSSDGVIHAYHLPPSLQSAESTGTGPASTLDAALARLERELLVEALKIEGGNAAAAARRLGVSERRIGLALRRYGIDWRRFRHRA